MKNLVQQVESNASDDNDDQAVLDEQASSNLLTLSGNQPVPVYVKPYTDKNKNKTKAKFGLSSTGTFYKGGLTWPSDAEYALFINFIFLPHGDITITNVDCDAPLLYTPVTNSVNQSCAIPPVAGTYKFYVKFSTGEEHDPQIVVTPQ